MSIATDRTLDAAPLNAAISSYCQRNEYSLQDVAVRIGRFLGSKPQTVDRQLARMRESGRVTLAYADDIAMALDLDINLLYPTEADELDEAEDDLSDLRPSTAPVVVSHVDVEEQLVIDNPAVVNGNGNRKKGSRNLSEWVEYDDDGPSTRDRILEYLERHGGEVRDRKGLLTGHLSEALGCPRATVTDVLTQLDRESVIERDIRATRTYRISLRRTGEPRSFEGNAKDFSRETLPRRRPSLTDTTSGAVNDREIEAMRWIVGTLLSFDRNARARMWAYVEARVEVR